MRCFIKAALQLCFRVCH